jgi:hypothetical protein
MTRKWQRATHASGLSVEWKPIGREKALHVIRAAGGTRIPPPGSETNVGYDPDYSYHIVNRSGKLELQRREGHTMRNAPLKGARAIGSNMTEVEHGDLTILYSYKTPVAFLSPRGGYVTDKQWSVTTSKHIAKFFDLHGYDRRGAFKVPQEDIEMFVATGKGPQDFPINLDPTPAEKRDVFERLTRRRGNPEGQLWYPGGVAIGQFAMGEAGKRYYVIPVESTVGWDFVTLRSMFPENLVPDRIALLEARLGYERSGQQGYRLFKVRVGGKWSRPLPLRTGLDSLPGIK